MDKIIIDRKILFKQNLIHENSDTCTRVYYYENDKVLKIFEPTYIMACNMLGIDIKSKILLVDGFNRNKLKEIVLPSAIVFDKNNKFCGYIMPRIDGVPYPDYTVNNQHKYDLYYYANIHNKFETIVKKGNEEGIIFPDLCTWNNILITSNGDVKFIDYDDFQINNLKSNCYSDALGNDNYFFSLGIADKNGLFNNNVDKLSLIYMYFLDTLRVDLSKIIYTVDITMTLDKLFYKIGLDDPDIQEKVCRLFIKNKQNEFLGQDLYRIAEMYTIDTYYDKNNVLSRKFKRK